MTGDDHGADPGHRAIKLRLFITSTAPDTDLTDKLVDGFPDGRAINLTDE